MTTASRSASGSAPGRLGLLGGVADHSGAPVLEIPTRVTTTVVVVCNLGALDDVESLIR